MALVIASVTDDTYDTTFLYNIVIIIYINKHNAFLPAHIGIL